jgi:hypothetical protein
MPATKEVAEDGQLRANKIFVDVEHGYQDAAVANLLSTGAAVAGT